MFKVNRVVGKYTINKVVEKYTINKVVGMFKLIRNLECSHEYYK